MVTTRRSGKYYGRELRRVRIALTLDQWIVLEREAEVCRASLPLYLERVIVERAEELLDELDSEQHALSGT